LSLPELLRFRYGVRPDQGFTLNGLVALA
jgi:hypothetical protein